MHQIAMQAADEALNTFNANMGAPTSLIKQQMLFAMGHSSAMVNIAYSVPPAERKRIATRISASTNYAVSMDHPVGDSDQTIADKLAVIASDDNSEQSIFQSATVTFQRMIKTLDPKGVFRLAKGISEPHA
jgi:hypothetical protein